MSDDKEDNVTTLPTKGHSLDKVFEERKKSKKSEADKAWKEASDAYAVFKNAYIKAKAIDAELASLEVEKSSMKELAAKVGL